MYLITHNFDVHNYIGNILIYRGIKNPLKHTRTSTQNNSTFSATILALSSKSNILLPFSKTEERVLKDVQGKSKVLKMGSQN